MDGAMRAAEISPPIVSVKSCTQEALTAAHACRTSASSRRRERDMLSQEAPERTLRTPTTLGGREHPCGGGLEK
jgi:hypothetical protein